MSLDHPQTEEVLMSLEKALNHALRQKSSEDTMYYDFNYLRVCLLKEVLNSYFNKLDAKRISSPQ